MQQLSVHDYYDLGKKLNHLERLIGAADAPLGKRIVLWPMFMARWSLRGLLTEPCALLSSSQRAVQNLIKAIDAFVPEDVEQLFAEADKDEQLEGYQLSSVKHAISNFETVFKNDLPEMSTFAVAKMSLFRTEDLISRSYLGIDVELRSYLPDLAQQDIAEAGKCLAFRVPTASAFHLSRAIETCMNQYFEVLTGGPFDLRDAAKNWAIKTKVLIDAGADAKITEFLTHIRKAYRNPITHPDVILEPREALDFFSQGLSVISIMLAAVKTLSKVEEQPMLEGLYASELGKAMLGTGLDNLELIESGEETEETP